jgi:hypothetical protein
MKMHGLIAAAVGGLMLAGASMASAGTIFSSIFSSPVVAPGGYTTFNVGDTFDGGNWVVAAGVGNPGNIDVINGYAPFPIPGGTGAQAVDLDGTDGVDSEGAINSAPIATVVGVVYQLSYWLAGNPGGGTTGFSTQITAGDTVKVLTSSSSKWTPESYSFKAISTSTVLNFAALTPAGQSGPDLADVTVVGPDNGPTIQSIPLPASAAGGTALLAGLFVAKIRSRKNSA